MDSVKKPIGKGLLLGALLIIGCQTGGLAAENQPVDSAGKSYEEYLDPTLPKEWSSIPLEPYEGERYEAEVPDTLDLAEIARECVNYLTRLAPEEKDGWAYHILYLGYNPAILARGGGQWKTPFFAECIPPMRAMSGSDQNLERDRHLIGPLVFTTGKDGLCYMAVEDRPWIFIDRVTREANRPYADMMSQGYQLNAYAMWHQHDKNALWKQLALRKLDRMLELAVPRDDTLYFRQTRGYDPWFEETGQGPLVALGDGDVVSETMDGGSAIYTICWTPQAAAAWYRTTGYGPALKLASGCARFLFEDTKIYDPETQTFKGLSTSVTYMLCSLLSYALTVDDREMIEWAERGMNQWLDSRDPDRTGIALGIELCQIADMVQLALMLGRGGAGDHWEIADRLMRNSMATMQITEEDVKRLEGQPVSRAGDPENTGMFKPVTQINPIPLNKPLPPGFDQPDDATERCRGAWFVSLENRSVSIGCCNNQATLALYLLWDSIVESRGDQLLVNLLMNRASPWADIESYLPHEGRVVVRIKTDMNDVLIRIPKWVDRERVSHRLTKKNQAGTKKVDSSDLQWSDQRAGYLTLGAVSAGDRIVVEFPVKEYVEEASIPIPGNQVRTSQVTYRGNTVIDLSDKTTGYPLHMREKYRATKAGLRTLERFVYPHSFDHWGLTSKP